VCADGRAGAGEQEAAGGPDQAQGPGGQGHRGWTGTRTHTTVFQRISCKCYGNAVPVKPLVWTILRNEGLPPALALALRILSLLQSTGTGFSFSKNRNYRFVSYIYMDTGTCTKIQK